MRKLFVSVLAMAALVACSQEQTLVQGDNGSLMEFNVAALDNATRLDPSITTETLKGFDVWAFVEDETGTVLGGLDANDKNGGENVEFSNGKWGYTNVQYWTPGNNYYFTAIAPMDSNNWAYDLGNTDNGEDNTITFKNIDGTEDLIMAQKQVTTPETIGTMQPVGLQFEHLLSKVRFTFKNEFTTNNVHFVVEDVQMVVPADGIYTVGTEAWDIIGGETTTLEFGDVEKMSMGKSKTAADERFTIPAAKTASYEVSFTLKHYNGDVLVNTYYKESTITGVVFEKGKAYNLVAGFNPENLDLQTIDFKLEGVNGWVEVVEANDAADIQRVINEAEGEVEIVLTDDINLDDLLAAGILSTRAGSSSASITIPAGKEVVLDLKDYNITGTDNDTANFGMFNIAPGAKLTIEGGKGKIQLTAKNERNWNAYSSVISNQRGTFVLNGGTIEHLGGTSMAYALDNLTNTGAEDAKATINGGVVKSTYRAIRLFLNSTKALDEVIVNGGTIEGANKSIWVQNANKNINPGKLVVAENAILNGDVMVSGSNASALDIKLSVAEAALKNGSTVIPSNLPAGYDVVVKDGNWVVEYGVEENGDVVSVSNAGGLKWVANQVNSGANYFEGKTIVLTANIDLKGEEWTPIGSASKDHGFMGNFDGNGFAIKNLAIENIAKDSDGYVYAGLFGVTEGSAEKQNCIKNLVIENVNIATDGHIVAAAIAYPYYTVVENVTVRGDISIKGGDYTAGVLAYTRRCVDAKNLTIAGNNGLVEGKQTIGGVISDIQMNGGLVANYSNFKATGLTVKGVKQVGGISGIISRQTLDGATVENVTIVCNDVRKGIVAGALGGDSTINRVSVNNVSGADYLVGALYGTKGHTVTIDGVVYEYLEDGSIMIDGKLSVANGVLADDAAYYISNKAGMFWFANEVNVKKNAFDGKTVKLTANVDLNNEVWTPVGQTGAKTFNGVFDGQNYTIYNLNVDSSSQTGKYYSSGLFGWVETHSEGKGILKNVKIENATIKGNHNCGALVGYITEKNARVQNCHVVNASIECHYANGDADGDKAGALIGNATNATLVDGCSATNSTVSAGRDAGQLIGAAKLENVTNCSATNVAVTANGEGTGNNIRNEVVGRVL